eukprot:142216-Rhodomonas_salina.2
MVTRIQKDVIAVNLLATVCSSFQSRNVWLKLKKTEIHCGVWISVAFLQLGLPRAVLGLKRAICAAVGS